MSPTSVVLFSAAFLIQLLIMPQSPLLPPLPCVTVTSLYTRMIGPFTLIVWYMMDNGGEGTSRGGEEGKV